MSRPQLYVPVGGGESRIPPGVYFKPIDDSHQRTRSMFIQLTPGQAVTLHGWFSPRLTLRWEDVRERDDLTFVECRKAALTLKQLHQLQPAIEEWVRYGGVTIANALEMHELWEFHPLRDLKADLADLLALRFGSEALRRMRVTYEDLLSAGMSPETMRMFGFSVLGWINLGFRKDHLANFTDAQITLVFALTRQAAEHCFLESGAA